MAARATVIAFFLFLAMVLASLNIYQEVIPDGQVRQQVEGGNEPLRHMVYAPNNRTANFRTMGLPEDLADEAVAQAKRLAPNKKRLASLLEEQALDVGNVFCPTPSALPQPYAAMEYLVVQEGGERDVVDARNALFAFEQQNWFSTKTNAWAIYEVLERTKRRQQDATLMGLSAILSMREDDAINRRGPWADGFFGGSFSTLESDMPSMRQKVVEYMALMHVLTEIANEPDGICAQ